MESRIIKAYDQNFLQIELVPISQKGQNFYIAKVPAKDVLKLFTVKPAEYDMEKEKVFASSFTDDEKYYTHRINELRKRADNKEFQRPESTRRVKEIAAFLNTKEYALFPNSIIVTCELVNNTFNIGPDIKFSALAERGIGKSQIKNMSFFEIVGNKYTLYVPYVESSLLVIDGQHRLRGLEEAKKEIINSYDLLLTFIIDYDRTVLAELFYTINYTQKSVNKSLLYHLSGEFSRELNAITFLHEAVKLLNELAESPFFKRVKMLGVIPKGTPAKDKAKMTISQAFLIDYLLPTISETAKISIHPPIFLYYFRHDKLQIEIIRFINKYFKAVKNIMEKQWDRPDLSIVSKTVSVGALIQVFHFLFVKMLIEDYKMDFSKITKITPTQLTEKLKGLANIDFSIKGKYGKEGSAGGLNKLKKEMVEQIRYFQTKKYDQFLKIFKKDYLPRFRKAI